MLSQKKYTSLVQTVNNFRNQIHLFNIEQISEQALDDLKRQITLFEIENPDKIDKNSPNYIIAGGIMDGFKKYTHKNRMLSLNDIFTMSELLDWQKRWQEYAKKSGLICENEIAYICEPKIDGLAISLHYQNGELTRAVTRGDGFVGEDVTENIRQILSIPKCISYKDNVEVRGEIFMTKSNFDYLNLEIIRGNKKGKMGKTGPDGIFANQRNVASGTIRQLDSRVVTGRNLSFLAYNVYTQ